MQHSLKLHGKASGKESIIEVLEQDLQKTMLEFLTEKSFPIASSCRGEGACQRCMINDDQLSCFITVEQFLKQYGQDVFVDYL
jgi:ferredoxin